MVSRDREMVRKIREICGPFDHHGHVVSDIQKPMADYLAIGIGPWFFITKDRMDRWDAREKRWHAYMCHLARTWDGITEPIRYAFPEVADDFQPDPLRYGCVVV